MKILLEKELITKEGVEMQKKFVLTGAIIKTPKGAKAAWHLNNLKMFMKTAEIDRQKFYEEQNIFEKYLPYSMIFGITGLWIKRMKDLYGEKYFNNYHCFSKTV